MQIRSILITITIIVIATPLVERVVGLGGALVIRALIATIFIARRLNSWFAFILFLIYITGLLVLFGYMLAIRPNPQPLKINLLLATLAAFRIIAIKLIKISPLPRNEIRFEIKVLLFYKGINSNIYWTIAIILLITLLIVVSICFKSPSPLRPFL